MRFTKEVMQKTPRWLKSAVEKIIEDQPTIISVVGVVPGIHLRQPQVAPAIERALCRFDRKAPAPAARHEVKAQLDIRLVRRIDPRPQSAAPDKPAALPLEQRQYCTPTDCSRAISACNFSSTSAALSRPRASIKAVTAGSPHNSIANGRSSARHDRATSRAVLNFSISRTTAEPRRRRRRSQRRGTVPAPGAHRNGSSRHSGIARQWTVGGEARNP
jgi:hypothetical protein